MEMAFNIVELLERRTGTPAIPFLCLVQGTTTLFAVVFMFVSLLKYDEWDLFTNISLSIFIILLSGFAICLSVMGIAWHEQGRDTRHPAIALGTFIFLGLSLLCQAAMITGLNIRWEFTEIVTAVLDVVSAISCFFTVVTVVAEPCVDCIKGIKGIKPPLFSPLPSNNNQTTESADRS